MFLNHAAKYGIILGIYKGSKPSHDSRLPYYASFA
jgi:hypothetical protein